MDPRLLGIAELHACSMAHCPAQTVEQSGRRSAFTYFMAICAVLTLS